MRTSTENSCGVLLSALGGVSLFLLAIFTYTRLTTFDPFQFSHGGSRAPANTVAFIHSALILGYWSLALLRSLTTRASVFCFFGAWLASLWGAILICHGRDDYCLKFDLGHQAWWLAIAIAALSAPLAVRTIRYGISFRLRRWAWVGTLSFGCGMVLYVVGIARQSPVEMLVKIVLILLIPAGCLLAISIGAKGKSALMRAASTLGAGVAVAAATIL